MTGAYSTAEPGKSRRTTFRRESAARHRSVFSQSLRLLTSWLRLFSVIAPEVGLGAGFQASSGFWDDFAELEIKIAAGQEAR